MQEIEFVALDCETTGLNSERDNIIELGAVKFSFAENLASFDSLFHSPTRISQFVERLTGIQNSDLKNAPQFAEKREEFQKFCEGKILLGHNLPFDLDFLAAAGLDLHQNSAFDTFKIAGLVLPRGESLSLENLSQKFQIHHADAHRALADAEATRDLLRVLIALAKNFSSTKWERIANLNFAEKSWVQDFAKLVLDSEVEGKKYEVEIFENSATRSDVVEKLSAEFSGAPKILEIAATPAEILAAVEKLEQPATLFFGNEFEVRQLPAVKIFPAKNFVDSAKLENFLTKNLSDSEISLAAKLILHSEKTLPELNLTRAESLLFDFVAAEKISQNLDSKVVVSTHAALPEFQNSSCLKIVADVIALPENLIRENSLTLDLSTLEGLLPQYSDKIQIWWGLLGLLFREATPRFGRLDFNVASGLKNFTAVVETGKNLLEVAQANLPPKVRTALENFLSDSLDFSRSLRSDFANEITLVIEPVEPLLPDLSESILLDAATDAGDDFRFAKKLLQLPESVETTSIVAMGELPRLFVVDDAPDPAAPQFFPAVEKFLLKNLPQFSGVTAVVFPNRMEAGNFAERATAELDFPVFFRKIPSPQKLVNLEKAVVILTTGSKFFPPRLSNFVSVKLPFIVRDDADWQTETLPATVLRFKKMWANFANSPLAEKFIALDPRLLGKPYGANFLRAIPQRHEDVKISG